jgi:hypothetical protein
MKRLHRHMIGNKPGFALGYQSAEGMFAHQRMHHLSAGFVEMRWKVQNISSCASLMFIRPRGERLRIITYTYLYV